MASHWLFSVPEIVYPVSVFGIEDINVTVMYVFIKGNCKPFENLYILASRSSRRTLRDWINNDKSEFEP